MDFIYTKYVQDFKKLTEDCHSHVVGDKDTPERKLSVSPNPFESNHYFIYNILSIDILNATFFYVIFFRRKNRKIFKI